MNSQADMKNTLKTCSIGVLNVFQHVFGIRRRIHSMPYSGGETFVTLAHI